MSYRSMGAYNGILPQPTGMLIGYIRDPKTFAYLQYAQLIEAPEISFMFCEIDPDIALRMVNLNEFAWGYDDYRPTGASFTARVKWLNDAVSKWDFPYRVGNTTVRVHSKMGLDPKQLYDKIRANHAALHRASRVVTALQTAYATQNTATLQDLIGNPGADLRRSSGTQKEVDGTQDPNFQVLKKMLNRIKRRLHLSTNGVVGRRDLQCVLPPAVAEAWSESGECFEALKQSQHADKIAGEDTWDSAQDWNIPKRYAGFTLVVEDTPRVFINEAADGTVADVTVPNEKDYILNSNEIYCVSRVGGLDGGYGTQNFSTVQVYHYGGEARVEAFSEPKHDLIEGHIVMEDKVLVPARASGFRISNVLAS